MGNKWPEFRLDEITTLIVDCPHSTPEWTDSGVIVLRSNNIRNGALDLATPSFTTEEGYLERIKRAIPSEEDIVLTREAPMGEVCIIPKGIKCCLGQRMVLIRADKSQVIPEYLLYVMQSSYIQHQISWNEGTGTTVSNIRIPNIKALKIPLPKITIQRKIVSNLLVIDKKIAINTGINQTLEQMSQTLFKSWFVDFDPVIDNALDAGNPIPEALQTRVELRKKVRNSVDFKPLSADIRSLFPSEFEETELGWVPKGWSFTALKNFGKIICGKTPTKSNKNYYGEDFLFIKIPDMHGKVFVTNSHDKLSKLGSESQSNKIIPHGSICVSCIATVGLVSINAQDCHTNQQINSIVPNSPHYRNYLYFSMLEKYKIFHDLASGGSATLNMNTSVFSNIATLMPNNLVLKQFHKITEPWFEAILLNEYKLTSLASLRDTLLPKLISGELSLDDLPDLTTDTEAA
ncbi:restriction endonuclease subunit S [Escherichia coli]|uniref:restriction endonuclease subunit S n=2 Tax=Escherichia coli TaxID=562 RepID=UPI000C33BE27|nr:restriction endonuclease subunit S [Escherichia coli]EFK8587032.1 restriction endonuclease subunit S [Escherichia coli]MQK84563.1 restriction endonuclease subunit S [Escherichia coli]PKE89891.1 restriction endonuclease subunit S [Escherichia coli]PLB76642.1 restriction endonuclease subunit S [Escherichia coli]PWD24352.1 restriction endonuclease subunit S [Escherichia coli]